MVSAKAENFENLRSVHCQKNAVSEFHYSLSPVINKLQNILKIWLASVHCRKTQFRSFYYQYLWSLMIPVISATS